MKFIPAEPGPFGGFSQTTTRNIVAMLVLGLTTNGLVAIGGGIVIAVVWIFVKFGQGMNVNIENIGDGNNITITK